jgi:hypothetical protein
MPALHATLGTSRSGERHVVVSTEVGDEPGRIEFPLDHVALAARRVGSRSAAQLWAQGIDAAWQLVGGAPLPEDACAEVRKVAARALGRLPATASTPVPINVVTSQWDGDRVLEAITDWPILPFEAERYSPIPALPGFMWRSLHLRDIAVGDRVHVCNALDGDVLDVVSIRHSDGVHIHVRAADGRVIRPSVRNVQPASWRDVVVAVDRAEHTLGVRSDALDSSGSRFGVALLALSHHGCRCEELSGNS